MTHICVRRAVFYVGAETEVLTPPRHKDIDVQQVVDLRRMLTNGGYGDVAKEPDAKGRGV